MVENQLVLINQPDDEHTFYSRAWRSNSSPDLAIATDDIQKISHWKVCTQLGGSDHKPVILTTGRQAKPEEEHLPPSWNYKRAV
jgi:hypothetical protein